VDVEPTSSSTATTRSASVALASATPTKPSEPIPGTLTEVKEEWFLLQKQYATETIIWNQGNTRYRAISEWIRETVDPAKLRSATYNCGAVETRDLVRLGTLIKGFENVEIVIQIRQIFYK